MNVVNLLRGGVILLALGIAGCGGGGGGSDTTSQSQSAVKFATSNITDKRIYLVDGSTYQLGYFTASGTAYASRQMTSGSPTGADMIGSASWSITSGGALDLQSGSDDVAYVLINDDTANRYYKVRKYSQNGVVNTVGMFYDQTTGLAQAQAFVTGNRTPAIGPVGSPCDGVDTSKTPDYISMAVVNGHAVTSSTWGACTK